MSSSAGISRLYDETDRVDEISALELIDKAERRVHEVNQKLTPLLSIRSTLQGPMQLPNLALAPWLAFHFSSRTSGLHAREYRSTSE